MSDDFSFNGSDAANMPLDLSFSSQPLPEITPGTGQEQASADINLLNGSDVMETIPSPFPAPATPSETEFRPQLEDPESLHDQGSMMMYGAAEREERRRMDKQARLMDVLRAGAMDEEGRKKAAELWGQDTLNRLDLADEHDRAYMLGNRLMETIGDGDRDIGHQIYKNANNLWGTDVVTADQIWKDFQRRHQKTLDAYNENLKRIQTEQEEISRRMVDCVAGKEGRWDACPADLLKYAERPQEVADSIMRARRAYAFAERRGFEDVWRSDALDIADLLTVNVNGNEVLDQQALRLLMTAVDRKVQESQTDSIAFWRNLYGSFADTVRGVESMGVKAVQAVRNVPGMSGVEEWYSNHIAPLQGVKGTFDGQRQLFNRYEQRREALNTMQDVMHEFGQRMRGTSPDASWYVKAINGFGNITGQSLSYMAPGGWALAMAGDMGHAGNAASRNGDSLVDVTINGLRNTVEEKGFGVFSVFGRMGAINKLMTKTGTGALARLAAKVPGRTFFAGTRTGKMLSTPAFAYVEEMAAEPLAGEVFEWTARKLSGLVGAEVKPKDFEVVGPVLQAMGDVEQSGGCALFVAAMAAGHAPRMKQEVAAFVMDAQRSQLAGYTKKHAEKMASFSTMEHRAALAQRYFETDILKDPEGAAERAREAGAELAERQEVRLYQMSGALDRVLERANIGSIRKLEGTDRYEVSLREGAEVNGVRLEEDRTMEMSEEQTDALVQVVLQGAYLNGVRVMQDAVLGNAAVSEAGKMDFIETLDMLSEEAPAEYRKAAAETGGMTVPGFMDVAARAQARIDAIVREEGVSVQEAGRRTDAEVMAKVQLGSIADLAAAFERRLDHAERSGEITRRRAGEIRSGTAAASSVHRFTMAADPGSSLLLYAGGHATTANVMEDVQESALVHYMNLTGKDWQDLWEHLQAADAVLGRYGMNLGTYEGPAKHAEDVVESFSNLSLSSSLADIENLPVPQWVKDTAEFALKNLEDSARIMRMGEQWNEFAATEEGRQFMKEHGGLADALQAVGVSTENVFRQARMDAAQKMDVEMVHADLASRRAPGDATLTLGELEALEESMARMDAAEDVEETAEDEEGAPPVAGNPASPAPLAEDADGALEGVGEEAEHDEEAGAEFRNHAFVRIAPDCVFAQVRVDALSLAPDVEQFKQGDHNERGAVKGRELQGRFREDAQPVSVWRRRDGALHVITGRHRFDLAVRDGVEFIPAYVYQEDEVHDATWAKMHDVGQNMLDGQASALEVAFFVRNSNMGRDEMEAQGYLRPGSANVMGWDIATLAGDEVFTRLKNGVITDHEAHRICRMSGTEAGQMLALQLREKGKPWDYVAAYVKEADRVAAEKSREGEAFDLFGNDTSWQEDCEKVARFTARGIAMIAERLSLLKKSRGISRRKDLAGRMGIRLETDADLNAAIRDLEAAKGAWQSHDPALRLHDRALAWDGTSEVNPFEHVPVSGATFSVVAMDSSGIVLGPDTFVTREDGSPDWFVIPRRKGQPDMPVRLLVGSDVGEHRGYGLTHILASRGFSFWKDRSPEHYISSILANVSELYEVAPGRELLVKGRQPSSWMLLQLDRKEGFYSIVSAYPVRQGKKPLGKKLPLAERQPANTNSGTARLGPGSASKAALPSQSAGGGDGFSLPQGARVVNVNEVECRFDDGSIVPATFSLPPEKEAIKKEAVAAGTFMKAPNGKDTNLTEDQWLSVRTEAFKSWFGDWEHDPENASKVVDENGEPRADYEDPTASFSLATRESIWVTLEREAQKNRLEVLRSQTAKALEIWRRVCVANDVKQGDGAEAFGRVMAVVASIYKTLPEGYRFGLYPYMRAAENLATRLDDGQAWLSDELKKETLMDDTSERMDAVIDKLLARTLEQADRYAVDQMRAEMVARIKAVQPTKKASGKFNKGKLSAEDYRHLQGIVAMMNTDLEAKEKRMLELEGVLSSNQSTEEERDAAELELKDWHTFGHLEGMGLEQTRACMRALAQFITTGRTAWSARLDEERRRTKFKAEKIVEGLGQATPQGGRDAEEDAKASTRTKAAKYLKYGLQSYSQLLNGWKKIPALRGLAHAEVTAIAEANVALRNMKHARDREVTALVKRCFGVQRTKDVARVLSDFKKTGDSGVVLNPLVKVERTVRIAEAREWVGLSFEEREERRKAIRKEYHDRGLSDDKASVPEALIPEMRRQLAELDELVKAGDGRARRRKNITAKAEVVRPGRKGETLKVSRAQAMYAILLYEQAEYVETMRNEGIGEAEVARLREFVGAEGLAFGYGLRELMNRQGKLLARVYEEREGVPFPAVENYFRAVFRADHKLDTKASFGEQTNAVAGGAKYGMLIPRRKHNLHLAWNMDCEAVFQAASAEVENYICTADITARWRGILADKEAAASLKEHMGRHGIDSLRHWLDVIDGAGVMEGGALLAGAQATSRFQSAKAVALLAWNVLTMLKQTSGLMHGMFAGEVGMGSFLLHLGQTMSMTGRMGVFEMMKTEAFRARTNDAQAEMVSQLMGYASDQNYNGAIRFSMAGMRAIEKMDVWSNAVSMTALYNAKWAELEEAGRRAGAPMTEDEMHTLCMQSVTRALELVAQPLTQSQKSMLGASTGLFAKMACFMSSEVLNKVGMIVSHVSAGNWGQALALYGVMSVAEQTVIALWHALLDDEDEWEKNGGWFGSMLGAPVAMIGGVPMLGAAVEFGYKQATGQRIYAGTASGVIDYSAIYRAAKNTWKAVTGEKEMTFADWAELILLDAKAAAYFAGAGAGSRSKAADSVASWLLSVAGVANLSKPGFSLAD